MSSRAALRAAILTVAMPMLLQAATALAEGPRESNGTTVSVVGKFAETGGLSGIACLPPTGGGRRCLVVNDEARFAEWATLEGTTLSATDARVQLLTKSAKLVDAVLGRMPQSICNATAKLNEFDGEAVALAGTDILVIGSHACSRKKGEFRPSSFMLARARATGDAIGVESVTRTWRVSDAILASSLAPHFGKHGTSGVNIEGMAVLGSRVYLGMRTPSVGGKPAILSVDLESLFGPGSTPFAGKPKEIMLAFGADTGIRDLAAIDGTTLMVLTGPTEEQSVPYVLHAVDVATERVTGLARLAPVTVARNGTTEAGKAEAIAVLGVERGTATVLVLYDNIDGGGPRLHEIRLPGP